MGKGDRLRLEERCWRRQDWVDRRLLVLGHGVWGRERGRDAPVEGFLFWGATFGLHKDTLLPFSSAACTGRVVGVFHTPEVTLDLPCTAVQTGNVVSLERGFLLGLHHGLF